MHCGLLRGFVVISVAMIATCGCGGARESEAKVTGSVTMGGAPQDGARLGFFPLSNNTPPPPAKGAVTNPDGRFEILLPPGKYKVTLSRMVDRTGKVPGESEDPSQDYAQLEASGMLSQKFPPAYIDTASTPISVEIPPEGKDLEPFAVGM